MPVCLIRTSLPRLSHLYNWVTEEGAGTKTPMVVGRSIPRPAQNLTLDEVCAGGQTRVPEKGEVGVWE